MWQSVVAALFQRTDFHENSQISQLLTVSLGVGTIIPSRKDKLMHFIEEVDQKLYLAKQKGRNRIVEGAS